MADGKEEGVQVRRVVLRRQPTDEVPEEHLTGRGVCARSVQWMIGKIRTMARSVHNRP